MQTELDEESTVRPIQILGINRTDKIDGNTDMTDGRDIPWLQDTEADDVWNSWVHEHRDVVILDENNERVGVFGLTNNDLSQADNYIQLKQMFLDAANKPAQ